MAQYEAMRAIESDDVEALERALGSLSVSDVRNLPHVSAACARTAPRSVVQLLQQLRTSAATSGCSMVADNECRHGVCTHNAQPADQLCAHTAVQERAARVTRAAASPRHTTRVTLANAQGRWVRSELVFICRCCCELPCTRSRVTETAPCLYNTMRPKTINSHAWSF